MGRKKPNLNRRSHVIEPKRCFIILCEGKNTEPGYFKALHHHYRKALISIQTIDGVGVPMTIANQAVEQLKKIRKSKDTFEKNDQVWAVFDRDNHPQHEEAIALCEINNVGIGRSNPCFEVWLILHIEDYHKPDDHHGIQRHLREICPDYDADGRKTFDCTNLISEVEKAEKRAERQLASRDSEGDPHGRPSTTIFRLTRAIREASGIST